MRLFLIILTSISLAACASTPKINRSPAAISTTPLQLQNSEWRILELNLNLKNIRGFCDLTKPNNAILDFSGNEKIAGGILLPSLHIFPSEKNMGCKLNYFAQGEGGYASMPQSSAKLEATFTFRVKGSDTVEFRYDIGNILRLNSEAEFTYYINQGWQQLFTLQNAMNAKIFLMKKYPTQDSQPTLAYCNHSGQKGMIGFRKQIVNCLLNDDGGSFRLEEI